MKLKPYSAYKESGIVWLGEIPEFWVRAKLKNISYIKPGYAFKSDEFQDEGVPVIRITDVIASGITDTTETKRIEEQAASEHKDVEATKGDILVAMTGATVGKSAIYLCDTPALLNQRVCRIRSNSKSNYKYIWYLLNSDSFEKYVDLYAFGGAQPNISDSQILEFEIAFPSCEEQFKIANFLDRETGKLETLIAKQEHLIELLQEKRQAIISHAVTKGLNPDVKMKDSGVEWLGMVPEGWEVKRLKHIKAIKPNAFVDGPFGSNLKTEHFILNGDAYVIESNFATQNLLNLTELKTISQKHFETIMRSQTKEGDIIIAKIGAQFGKASILPQIDKPAVVSGNSMKLSVNEKLCGNQWAYWQLTNLKMIGEINLLSNGSAQPALSLGAMNNLPFLLPSVSEQDLILNYISKKTTQIDTLIDKTKRSIELAKEHRTSIISAAVTGKIDVREAA